MHGSSLRFTMTNTGVSTPWGQKELNFESHALFISIEIENCFQAI
jgi:hypothetical protein